mmetsp:Transcript_65205/g.176231  ORF Transcript_65205/g.176231 Transcript_65205/m.176231 type:complete len:210 (+) Transcript_65205:350-979(+)
MLMYPEESLSRWRQTPATLPSNLTSWHAASNSDHEILFELFLSSRFLHAMSGWSYLSSSSSRNFSHASGSGSAQTHSGGSHPSSHSKSARVRKPQPCRSSDVRSETRSSLSSTPGHPKARKTPVKFPNRIRCSEFPVHFPLCLVLRADTAWRLSQTPVQLPNSGFLAAQCLNWARMRPRQGENSSRPTDPSSSRSNTCQRSRNSSSSSI